MSTENICETHDKILKHVLHISKILEDAKKILQAHSDDNEEINSAYDYVYDAIYEIDKITDWTDKAKESGQSMENRLTLYRSAIEDLGFKREK